MKSGSKYVSFHEAREWARRLKLKSARAWLEYVKFDTFPSYIPKSPNTVYKDEWQGYSDWLRDDGSSKPDFIDYDEAKSILKKINIESRAAYFNLSNKRKYRLPKSPHIVYKDRGWKGWSEYLSIDDYSKKIEKLIEKVADTDELSSRLKLSKPSIKRIQSGETVPLKSSQFQIDALYRFYFEGKKQYLKSDRDKKRTQMTGWEKVYLDSISDSNKLIRELKGTELRYAYDHMNNPDYLRCIEKITMLLLDISFEKEPPSNPKSIKIYAELDFRLSKYLLHDDIKVFGHFRGGYALNPNNAKPSKGIGKSKKYEKCNLIWIGPIKHKNVIQKGNTFVARLKKSDFSRDDEVWGDYVPE